MKLMYMSGTSVSAPVVTGTAALLLEANPNLTPNMVKMILMYTAQPLAGFNTFEQGAGQVNVAGAVAIAKIMRTDLLGLLPPSPGSSLLPKPRPVRKPLFLLTPFPWSQGLVLNHATISGKDLLNKYQQSYAKGYLLGDGVIEGTTTQSLNTNMWKGTLSLGNYLMKSDGTALGGGGIFCANGIMLSMGSC